MRFSMEREVDDISSLARKLYIHAEWLDREVEQYVGTPQYNFMMSPPTLNEIDKLAEWAKKINAHLLELRTALLLAHLEHNLGTHR